LRYIRGMQQPPIRRARREDVPRIAEIRFAVRENRLVDASTVPAELVHWFIDNPGIWLWDEAGEIKGFAAADTRDGSVWALFVDPKHESRGVGHALFEQACAVLRDAGHRSAWLRTGEGTRAERFYRKRGWIVTGRHATGDVILTSPPL
jgi:GNAT superfamily N-acetyltransferase